MSVEKPYLTDAPALVVVFVQSWRLVQRELGDELVREKHYFADESVSIAVGFLLAALQVAGLATLVHTPSPMTFLKNLLNRPPGERAMFVIPVGYPQDNAQVPVLQRRELDEVYIRIS